MSDRSVEWRPVVYTDYHEAARIARLRATATGLDIAIRRVREYGKDGFNVSFAARNDSDYALAEIVKPGEPQSGPAVGK